MKTRSKLWSALILAAALPAQAGDLNITDFASKDAILVVGADSWENVRTWFDSSLYGQIVNDPGMQNWFRELEGEFFDGLLQKLEDYDIELADIGWPVGAAGIVIEQPEGPGSEPDTVFIADFGERAEDVFDIAMQLVEGLEDDDEVEIEEEEYGDWTLFSVKPSEAARERRLEEFRDQFDQEFLDQAGDMLEFANLETEMSFTRMGDVLVTSNTLEGLQAAIDRAEDGGDDTIASSRTFNSTHSMIDRAGLYAVGMVETFIDMYVADLTNEAAMFGDDSQVRIITSIMEIMGLRDIGALAFGIPLDQAGPEAEMLVGLHTYEKKGLVELFDRPAASFEAPRFVDADAVSLISFQFDFAGLIPLIQQSVATMPPDQQAMMGMMRPMFEQALQSIGPDINIVQYIDRPFTFDSKQFIVGVRCAEPDSITGVLGQLGAMTGLTARDFEGGQVWESQMSDSGLGIGAGHIFIGSIEKVENALRLAGSRDGLRLADTDRFERAQDIAEGDSVVYAFQEMTPSLEYDQWQLQNMPALIRREFEAAAAEFGGDGDDAWREEFIQSQIEELEANPMYKHPMPMHVIKRYMGDAITWCTSRDDGFVMHMLQRSK